MKNWRGICLVTLEGLREGGWQIVVTSQLERTFAPFLTLSSSPSSRPCALRVELHTTGWEEWLKAQERVHHPPDPSFNKERPTVNRPSCDGFFASGPSWTYRDGDPLGQKSILSDTAAARLSSYYCGISPWSELLFPAYRCCIIMAVSMAIHNSFVKCHF